MDGWMVGWMDGWMDGYRYVDAYVYVYVAYIKQLNGVLTCFIFYIIS